MKLEEGGFNAFELVELLATIYASLIKADSPLEFKWCVECAVEFISIEGRKDG